jgi:tetratricopeptide (TPR) repeat protein
MSRLSVSVVLMALPVMGALLPIGSQVSSAGAQLSATVMLAQKADQFPPNPLEVKPDDLLPNLPPETVLKQMAELNQQALDRLQANDADAAFALWNQALSLSRVLGPIAETQALAQVGQIAWERNNTQQVGYIRQRLQQIQAEHLNPPPANSKPDLALLTELAAAYQVIRAPELALQVYDRLLASATQSGDPLAQFQLLNQIAQTHLDWFAYPKAAKVYQDLLTQARERDNRSNQLAYTYQLAYIYEQAKQPEPAIEALKALIERYTPTPEPLLLANFQLRLAEQYRLNQQAYLAETTYQLAYRTAVAQQQSGFAGDALRQLARFYRQQQRLDAAIQVYDFLTTFEQEVGFNAYNTMDAYDHLGQIFLEQQSRPQAIAAFQQGLQLAQALNYRIEYFQARINEATTDDAAKKATDKASEGVTKGPN